MRGVLIGFAAGVAVGAAGVALLRSDAPPAAVVAPVPSLPPRPETSPRPRASRRTAEPAESARPESAAPPGAAEPPPSATSRPASDNAAATPAPAAPKTEADLVAALKALEEARPADRDKLEREFHEVVSSVKRSETRVSSDLVASLLVHDDDQARYAGADLILSAEKPPVDLVLDRVEREPHGWIRDELAATLPHLGDKGVARAVELVLEGCSCRKEIIDGLVSERRVGDVLTRGPSREVLGALEARLRPDLTDSDEGRALAASVVGRIGDLADACADRNDCVSFLCGMVEAGQGARVAALALDPSRSTMSRESVFDAVDDDVAVDVARRLVTDGPADARLRIAAVRRLELAARDDDSDRPSLLATLRSCAAKDASAEVREEARKAAERVETF